MTTRTFPKDFYWGSAASAEQTEGNQHGTKVKTIWDHWYNLEPNRFFDEVGPSETSDFYHRYKEDIKNMKDFGHNSFRLSLSWARLLDESGQLNREAVTFYNDVIDTLIAHEIEPFVNLFHFDMPLYLQEQGGFESRKVVDLYVDYAKIAFSLFSDRVKVWFTFNEPIVPVEGGYLYDFHYPNVVDAKRAFQVAYHTMIAHKKVCAHYHDHYDGKIGIILNLTPSYPRSQHPSDLKASHICDLFFNRSFLDPVVKGEYPEDLINLLKEYDHLPETKPEDTLLLKNNPIDFLGVNYYQPRRVKAKTHTPHPDSPFLPDWFFDNYEMPGRKMNVYRGWEIYEKGIYDIMINLRDNYNNIDCFISENGMGVQNEARFIKDGRIEDDYRIDFIYGHLTWLHRALIEGCNVKGYHLWTFMDNWSWANAYKNRYGFFSVDLETKHRTAKKSAFWFKQLAETNELVH
ncbi:6-phospho-beta-glucosidase [Halolactibacillus miurensis]|uniref:6-phospho-beta-glucosidase n=2 Tax=Halolactibacillus miurensis TaxID=306541 RepID=A0A1I6PBG0_9BACI|nr:glycoside hydrolase family 1 protein [Halolactibacillus miurensis]GEM05299.1 6-phospho-beta-glucosidase [Halolactibacillus miurensis]SFS37503.1 6-phospho-beta-glucosidase [Halolactibacillus miurensis]